MNLKQLQYFTSVAELGNFTAASALLDVAQPTLSRQVRALEVELHQVLLRRNGRGVTTTEAGDRLLAHCRGILHQVDLAKEDVSGGRNTNPSGRVVVGLPPTVASLMAVSLARRFRAECPGAAMSIRVDLSAVMRRWLTGGGLDIALLYNPTPSPELELSPLARDPLYLVGPYQEGSPHGPITLSELALLPIVIPSRPNTIRMLLERRLASLGMKPRVTWEVDGVATILGLVADGAGYAVLSEQAIEGTTAPERFQTRPITDPPIVSELYFATAAARFATGTQKIAESIIRATIDETYTTLEQHRAAAGAV